MLILFINLLLIKLTGLLLGSFRGLGVDKGLEILSKVKKEFDVPVLTDVHEDTALDEVRWM